MKMSYKKLWIMLAERELEKSELRKLLGFSPNTMTKLNKNEEVSLSVLLRICECLKCNIGDICDAVPEEATNNNV
jgi:putative transcriptional regulator